MMRFCLLPCWLLCLGPVALAQSTGMFGNDTATPAATPSDIIEPQLKAELLSIVPTLTVGDLRRAADFYTSKLGFAVELTTPNYVVVGRDGVKISLALDKARTASTRMSCYINVNGVDALHKELTSRQVKLAKDIATQPSKMREFMVIDPDNNTVIFGEYTGR